MESLGANGEASKMYPCFVDLRAHPVSEVQYSGLSFGFHLVRQEIRSDAVTVTGSFSREEAEEMALIPGYPLESPLVVSEVSEAGRPGGENE